MTEKIHACLPGLSGVTPCCGKTPFELPRTDYMTVDPQAVTCTPNPTPTPGLMQCPTCGPTPTEPHPRLPGVDRCANCKTHVPAPAGEHCGATVACGHPADEHSVYGCADGCACEWMPKRAAPIRRVPRLAGPAPACSGTDGFCAPHGFHRHAPAPDGLRDQVAEALMAWAERNNAPQYAAMRRPDTVRQNAYSRADAVLAVFTAELQRLRARVATLEHVAAGNKRHVQMLIPELERAEATVERVRKAVTERRTELAEYEAEHEPSAWSDAVSVTCSRIEDALRIFPESGGIPCNALTPKDPS